MSKQTKIVRINATVPYEVALIDAINNEWGVVYSDMVAGENSDLYDEPVFTGIWRNQNDPAEFYHSKPRKRGSWIFEPATRAQCEAWITRKQLHLDRFI